MFERKLLFYVLDHVQVVRPADDGPGPGAYEPCNGDADGPALSMASRHSAASGVKMHSMDLTDGRKHDFVLS